MNYLYLLILLVMLVVGAITCLYIIKGEIQLFTKRTNRFLFFTFLIFAVLGNTGLLINKPANWNNTSLLSMILQIAFLGLGLLYLRLLNRYHRWYSEETIKLLIPFTVLTIAIASLGFFILFWLTERPFFKELNGVGDNLTFSIITGLVPIAIVITHQFWNKIPIVINEMIPWELDITKPVPIIEPSAQSLRLIIAIPVKYKTAEMLKFDIQANLDNQLGDIFYNILDTHNIRDRSPKQIEFAENNQKDHIFGWLFYQKEKKRWWQKKEYIDPYTQIRYSSLKNGDIIFTERVKDW